MSLFQTFASQVIRILVACIFPAFTVLPGAYSQSPVFVNYTIADGLPGNDVYGCVSDSLCNLYFGTNQGVARFDGRNFILVKDVHGKNLSSVIRLEKDRNGVIWAILFNGMVEYLDGSVFRPVSDLGFHYYENYMHSGIVIESIRCEEEGGYTFSIQNRGIVSTNRSFQKETNNLPAGFYLDLRQKEPLIFSIFHGGPAGPFCKKFFLNNGGGWKQMDQYQTSGTRMSVAVLDSQYVFLGLPWGVLEIDRISGKVIDFVECLHRRIVIDNNKRVWVSCGLGDLRVTEPGQHLSTLQPFPISRKMNVVSIMQDYEGGMWFTTEKEGVFYSPNIAVRSYQLDSLNLKPRSEFVMDVDDSNNVIVAGADKLFFLKNGKLLRCEPLPAGFLDPEARPDIVAWGNESYALLSHSRLRIKNKDRIISKKVGYSLCLSALGDSALIIPARVNTIEIINLNNGDSQKEDHLFSVRQERILPNGPGGFFIGSIDGLYQINSRKLIFWGTKIPSLSHRITAIKRYDAHTIIVGTAGAGMVIMRDNRSVTLNTGNGFPENWIRSITCEKNRVWVTGNKSVYCIKEENNGCSVRSFFEPHGLYGSEFSNVAAANGYIYVTYNSGLFVFKENDLPVNEKGPLLVFSQALINNMSTELLGRTSLTLPFDSNNVRLAFENRSFRLGDFTRYRYRIPEFSDEYFYTNENYIVLDGLKPGNYHVELEACNEDNIWAGHPYRFSITITPHWTGTNWFIVLMWIGTAALLAILLLLYSRYLKRRSGEKLALLESQQIALARLMNPHFVFNVLHSLQGFVLMEERTKSARLIADFSRIMRLSIDNTRFKFVSLESEAELLHKYLEIERMQHQEKFSYRVDTKEVEGAGILIPPMILQPIVENSVKHGILPLSGSLGEIRVKFYFRKKSLVCRIMDNGVGCLGNTENEKKEGKHISSGIQITKNRLRLLHKQLRTNYFFEQRSANAESKTGCLTEFAIPFQRKSS